MRWVSGPQYVHEIIICALPIFVECCLFRNCFTSARMLCVRFCSSFKNHFSLSSLLIIFGLNFMHCVAFLRSIHSLDVTMPLLQCHLILYLDFSDCCIYISVYICACLKHIHTKIIRKENSLSSSSSKKNEKFRHALPLSQTQPSISNHLTSDELQNEICCRTFEHILNISSIFSNIWMWFVW